MFGILQTILKNSYYNKFKYKNSMLSCKQIQYDNGKKIKDLFQLT